MKSFNPRSQSGAVLVVSILMLLVMTILALSMSQTARMQERMAGNSRDAGIAFQASEAALRNGEARIDDFPDAPITCTAPTTTGTCQIYEPGALASVDLTTATSYWTGTSAFTYGAAAAEITSASADPQYILELVEFIGDDDHVPPAPGSTRYFYRVTSNAVGGTSTAKVMVESTFAERF